MSTQPGARHQEPVRPRRHPVPGRGRPAQGAAREHRRPTGAPPSRRSTAFTNGDMVVGTTWQYQASVLAGATPPAPVKAVKPKEGTTGWSDTWMISSKAKHPNCMYKWMDYIISPTANAQATVWFGEAPVSPQACAEAEKLSPGHCDLFHATDEAYFKDVYYWNTPTAECLDGRGADLQGLLRVDEGLDRDQGLSPDRRVRSRPRRPPGRRGRLVSRRPAASTTRPMTDDDDDRATATRPARRRPSAGGGALSTPAGAAARPAQRAAGWLLIAYVGSLVVLFISAFWRLDPFTGDIVTEPSPPELRGAAHRRRSTGPSRSGRSSSRRPSPSPTSSWPSRSPTSWPGSPRPRTRALLVVSILLPLWSGYLVKVYAWRLILSRGRGAQLATRAVRPQGAGLRRRGGLAGRCPTCGCRT